METPAILSGGFHHVALRVKDFDASVRFYCEGLGCRPFRAWGNPGGRAIMLDVGNGDCLELFEGRTTPPPAVEAAILHLALRTADCDRAVAAARGAGATVTIEPKDVDIPSLPATYPVRIAFVTGPDSEVIEFFQER